MGFLDRLRGKRGAAAGPEGVAIRIRTPRTPRAERPGRARAMPHALKAALAIATAFYLLAHYSIVQGVWPVHGTAPHSGAILLRDVAAMFAWLLLIVVLHLMRYRGSWAVVALPVVIFFFTRPSLFQLFTDPAYQAQGKERVEANALKAERSRLTTVVRAYDEPRQELVFGGAPPKLPDPVTAIRTATRPERASLLNFGAAAAVILAPLVLLLAYMGTKRLGSLRWARDQRRWIFALAFAIFLAFTMLPGVRATGKVAGTTPWELLLPVFVLVWAAVLADDAYNLARPGAVLAPRRILGLVLYGALPLVPFLLIHELGLSVVLAGSLAAMLLVGTRRGWWAGLMLVLWVALVFAAFHVDQRSQTRLELAYHPYPDPAAMTQSETEAWAAKNYQIKLFDANILAGGWLGAGPGRGHAETAPDAADDGYITTIAAQWGWAGALSLVLLYTAFLVQMLAVAVRERGAFERSLVTGLAMLIAIPFWLATLGGIRVIPLTGVAAAFAAHGGAKLLASALAVGIVAGVSQRRAEEARLEAVARSGGDLSEQGVRIR
ncbi:MAG TPA: FtsW/RodA/SpoVE family cell cycle protein [Longimicrobiaceae bacterium]|nr:FtsW/RodA/SpoVE family cell cycle protein [Longimicrobiaceae bacterium]